MGMIELKLLQDRMNELEKKIEEIGRIEDVNTNRMIPLNHYFWLEDFKTNGDNSYITQSDEIYTEAMMSYLFSIDPVVGPQAVDYLNNLTDGFGIHIQKTFNLSNEIDYSVLGTVQDVIDSDEAICDILIHDKARRVLFNNYTFLKSCSERTGMVELIRQSEYGKKNIRTIDCQASTTNVLNGYYLLLDMSTTNSVTRSTDSGTVYWHIYRAACGYIDLLGRSMTYGKVESPTIYGGADGGNKPSEDNIDIHPNIFVKQITVACYFSFRLSNASATYIPL